MAEWSRGQSRWSQDLLNGGAVLKGKVLTEVRTLSVKGAVGEAVNKGSLLTLVVLRTGVIRRVYGIWHYDQTM